MKDIAEKLGISVNAVSLALNNKKGISEETKKAVLNLAEEMGYIDQNLKFMDNYSKNNICIIIDSKYHNMDFYFNMLVESEKIARTKHLNSIVCFYSPDEDIPFCVKEKKVFGILIIGMLPTEYIYKLSKYIKNIILLDFRALGTYFDSVQSDNKQGGYMACMHLLKSGHKDIGFFGDLDYSESIRDRYWGYLTCLSDYNNTNIIEVMNESVKLSILRGLEKHVIRNDYEVVKNMLGSIRLPKAFVCSNDKSAYVLMKALEILNIKVPYDISLVGFDNVLTKKDTKIGITTMSVDIEKMSKIALHLILNRKNNKNIVSQNVLVGVDLIEKESIKKIFS